MRYEKMEQRAERKSISLLQKLFHTESEAVCFLSDTMNGRFEISFYGIFEVGNVHAFCVAT